VAAGDLAGDVAVRDVEVGLGRRAALQAVRLVVPAHDRQRPVAFDLGLHGGDLAVEDRRPGERRLGADVDLQAGADVEAAAREHRAHRVAEGELERVGQVDLVLDDGLQQRAGDVVGQRHAADLDVEDVRGALGGHQDSSAASAGAGTSRSDPMRRLNGSSIWLALAIARHIVGLP
jgi:hypothetical protein